MSTPFSSSHLSPCFSPQRALFSLPDKVILSLRSLLMGRQKQRRFSYCLLSCRSETTNALLWLLPHVNSGQYRENHFRRMSRISPFTHAATIRKLSVSLSVFIHVRNSLGESRGAQAATLQGWTTGHVSAAFNSLSCQIYYLHP